MSEKGRERVIARIETLDQAVKAEKDVEMGYHGAIDENITFWLAAEEDIIDSYSTLLKNAKDAKTQKTLTEIINDSKNHIKLLTSIKETFDKIASDEHRHAKLLEELKEKS
jgi:rubrerythrin